jgi:hypothetical protein
VIFDLLQEVPDAYRDFCCVGKMCGKFLQGLFKAYRSCELFLIYSAFHILIGYSKAKPMAPYKVKAKDRFVKDRSVAYRHAL